VHVRRHAHLSRRALAFGLVLGALAPATPLLTTTTALVAPVVADEGVSNAGPSAYVPLTPVRLADTRPDSGVGGFTALDTRAVRVVVAGRGGVPANASAVVVNITAVDTWAPGFVTAFPAGEAMPTASSLNVDQPGRVISNLATVRLGQGGAIDLVTSADMHLVVDVVGAYTPRPTPVAAGRLETFPGGARRVLDTRDTASPLAAGTVRSVDVGAAGVPAGATAVVVNLVATEAQIGFWTAFPNGAALPLASTLNIDAVGQTRSAQAIVALPAGATSFQVFSMAGGHLVVDVAGWFTGAGAAVTTAGLFVPASPQRVLDTRAQFPLAPWGGSEIEFGTGSPFAGTTAAVALNITATDPWYMGYVTVHPAGVDRPLASNLNITSFDQTIANHAIVRAGTRGLAVYTQSGTQLVADVAGWYLGTPEPSVLPEAYTAPSTPVRAVGIAAPSIGLGVMIGTNRNIDVNINQGLAGLWLGSGDLGWAEHNVYFAHRTSHGGVFRNIDRLTPGSTFSMVGVDGRTYQYLVTRQDVILPKPAELLRVVNEAGPVTVTLVACHPPGKITYRLAVTGRLIGVSG
jgi:LPXTG-site transpeptidase (sortase) family protein